MLEPMGTVCSICKHSTWDSVSEEWECSIHKIPQDIVIIICPEYCTKWPNKEENKNEN